MGRAGCCMLGMDKSVAAGSRLEPPDAIKPSSLSATARVYSVAAQRARRFSLFQTTLVRILSAPAQPASAARSSGGSAGGASRSNSFSQARTLASHQRRQQTPSRRTNVCPQPFYQKTSPAVRHLLHPSPLRRCSVRRPFRAAPKKSIKSLLRQKLPPCVRIQLA